MNVHNNINGSDKFEFIDATANVRYNFSPYYQALLYSFAPEIVHHYIPSTGKNIQIPLGWKYYYELDYSQLLLSDDGLKVQDVLNKLMEGNKIFLVPHTDVNNRFHRVYLDPEQTMDLHDNYWGQGNKGLVISLMTDRLPKLDWVDPSNAAIDLIPVGVDLNNIVY